jgi:hypothetical protein
VAVNWTPRSDGPRGALRRRFLVSSSANGEAKKSGEQVYTDVKAAVAGATGCMSPARTIARGRGSRSTGTPLPVAAVGAGALTFAEWNKEVSVSAPKGADNISTFGYWPGL